MAEKEAKFTVLEFHKKMAVETNNGIWPVLDAEKPNREQLEEAMHMAHASRFHWGKVGSAVNLARADYMISRVYCAMGRGEPALFHARRCLEICEENGIGDFDLAFAYEVIARAYGAAGSQGKCKKYRGLAQEAIDEVEKDEDRKICQGELDKVKC